MDAVPDAELGRRRLDPRAVGHRPAVHAQGRHAGRRRAPRRGRRGHRDLGVNHGGNNLDGTPASIRALPAVAAAVGDQVEVLLDGGIRRGGDVAKALALGARAVMIGRAYLWGLAANGQAGVENVLDLLRDGLGSAMIGLGHPSISELSRAEAPGTSSGAAAQAEQPSPR